MRGRGHPLAFHIGPLFHDFGDMRISAFNGGFIANQLYEYYPQNAAVMTPH